ncbi:MAG: hypothetical protein PVI90_08210 [Desulfobacteraceae bacterium]|jgi:hypothetical protein
MAFEDKTAEFGRRKQQNGVAGQHYIHNIIDPRNTRSFIVQTLAMAQESHNGGISQHKLANWPTKF